MNQKKKLKCKKKRLKRRLHEKNDEFGVERKLDLMERTKEKRKKN